MDWNQFSFCISIDTGKVEEQEMNLNRSPIAAFLEISADRSTTALTLRRDFRCGISIKRKQCGYVEAEKGIGVVDKFAGSD